MKIMGLQKLTLLDFPGKIACTVFTGGCNFRCPFCHNAGLVLGNSQEPEIREEEFFEFLDKRKGILNGVCITGGEPTLQRDLEEFIRKIREKGFLIKLDTNGYRPEILKDLAGKGLIDYVAMDIKNSPTRYSETAGLETDIDKIGESIEFLMSGAVAYEFRTTVVRQLHSPEDIQDIGVWIQGATKYFLQGFEDSGNLISQGYSGYEKDKMLEFLSIVREYVPSAEVRGI